MNGLKQLPITYVGELHDVQLIQFSVAIEEVASFVPSSIVVKNFDGRAMISLVNVCLKKMRPGFFNKHITFEYQHIAFRLLVEDAIYHGEKEDKGIYFLRSFTNKPLVVVGGKLFTDYQLEYAQIASKNNMLELRKKEQFLHYALEDAPPKTQNKPMKTMIETLDRAYSAGREGIRMVQIQREAWPIEWVNCYYFATNFFETARLEGAFKVRETIHYQWLPPQQITLSVQQPLIR